MEQDCEDFYEPPPVLVYSSGAEDFYPTPPDSPARVRGGGRQGRPRAPPKDGTVGVWVVSLEAGHEASSSSVDSPLLSRCELRRVEGLGTLSWRFVAVDGEVGALDAGGAWGEVVYQFTDLRRLGYSCDVPPEVNLDGATAARQLEEFFGDVPLADGTAVSTFFDASPLAYNRCVQVPKSQVDAGFRTGVPFDVKTVRLGKRVSPDALLVGAPPMSAVRRWRKEAGVACMRVRGVPADPRPSRGERALLKLPRPRKRRRGKTQGGGAPAVRKKEHDALKIVDAVAFSLHLRQVADFSEAMQDAKRYEAGDVEEEVQRDASADPSRPTLQRAARRLDLVGMNLERRLWHKEVDDDNVLCVNCYSDSSPVTGTEIQGMLADVVTKDERVRRVTMPGGTVFYGAQDAIQKTMVFIWSAWLVFGPDERYMEHFRQKVRCWSTDFGVESLPIDLPDCLQAFMAWLAGMALEECRHLVKCTRRFFYRSFRVNGWNHSCGNVMKRVAKSYVRWPDVLDGIRHLCRFWRNQSWREWVKRALLPRHPTLDVDLAHFTAGCAKWRFETIVVCLVQLTPLRPLCEHDMCEELFSNAQEKEFIKDFLKACRDKGTWCFIVFVCRWIMEPLEHIRRWGLICPCDHCNKKR